MTGSKHSRLGADNTDWFVKKPIGGMDGTGQNTRSRNSDGNVPNVNWNDGKLNVNWNYADNANDNLRSRAEVSMKRSS